MKKLNRRTRHLSSILNEAKCVENPADCGGDLETCSDGKIRCDAHADSFSSHRFDD